MKRMGGVNSNGIIVYVVDVNRHDMLCVTGMKESKHTQATSLVISTACSLETDLMFVFSFVVGVTFL